MKFHHIGLVVHDSGYLVNFFKLLGLSITDKFFDECEDVNTIVMNDVIHILEPLSDESPITKFSATLPFVFHHVAFEVDDLKKIMKEYDISSSRENSRYKFVFHLKYLSDGKKILIEFIEEKGNEK